VFLGSKPNILVEMWVFELTFLPQKTQGIQRQVAPDPRQHWGFAHTLSICLGAFFPNGHHPTGVGETAKIRQQISMPLAANIGGNIEWQQD
jgi:hypothetical protein